jgi:hypothetical protein
VTVCVQILDGYGRDAASHAHRHVQQPGAACSLSTARVNTPLLGTDVGARAGLQRPGVGICSQCLCSRGLAVAAQLETQGQSVIQSLPGDVLVCVCGVV